MTIAQQPSLFEDAPKASDRLFFALFPDARTADRIAVLAARLRKEHGLTGAALLTERFHITLNDLGLYAGVPKNVVNAAMDAAANLSAPSFDVVFDFTSSFFNKDNNNPFVLRGGEGLAALKAFQQALGFELMKVGLKRLSAALKIGPSIRSAGSSASLCWCTAWSGKRSTFRLGDGRSAADPKRIKRPVS